MRLTTTGVVSSVREPREPGQRVSRMVRLTAKEKGDLASLVTNGQWPQARKADTGMVASDACLLCGARGTLLHRHCDCDAWRDVLTTPAAVGALRARAHAGGDAAAGEVPVASTD